MGIAGRSLDRFEGGLSCSFWGDPPEAFVIAPRAITTLDVLIAKNGYGDMQALMSERRPASACARRIPSDGCGEQEIGGFVLRYRRKEYATWYQ